MSGEGSVPPSQVSVVIATYCRPDVLRRCLEHLLAQTASPFEIVVVDASPDDVSRDVVASFPTIRYLRNDEGMGTLPRSRQIGLAETGGEVIAFLDDDAFADPRWLVELASTYADGVGGVGGQARNGVDGEEQEGCDQVGRLYADGTLTGFFAADTGSAIDVDHLIGCNMSFRREALVESGGVPAWPAGVSALREDLFLSLRVRDTGWRLRYNPRAGVLHIGAPQAHGRRFDLRYVFNGSRNHYFVLVAHYGLLAPIVWRSIWTTQRGQAVSTIRVVGKAVAQAALVPAGTLVGIWRGVQFRRAARRGVRPDR